MVLRIALEQVNPTVGDLTANAALVLTQASAAAGRGANLIVFPEMVLTGYPVEDLALRRSFQQAAAGHLAQLAQDLSEAGAGASAVIVGSLGTAADGTRPTNIAAVLRHGTVEAVYTKRILPNYGVFDEYRLFAPGSQPVVIGVAGHTVGLAICEDIWEDSPDGPVAQLAARPGGIDLLAVLNGSPYEFGKSRQREDLAALQARRLGAPVAYVNLVGGQDDLVFDGGSFVVDQTGQVVAGAGRFHPQTLLWEPGSRGTGRPETDRDEETYRAIVLGLGDYARKNGFTGTFLIEPKPMEPTKHQYDFDTETVIGFLRYYGLDKDFKVNIEVNHATLAGHTFEHELQTAADADMLGSIDANRGDYQNGWDTDQFPVNIYELVQAMLIIVENGGFTTGGTNFDAKTRRNSTDPEDIFIAHISGMDTFARALVVAADILEKSDYKKWRAERYASFDSGDGKAFEDCKMTLENLRNIASRSSEPAQISGRQELYETLINLYI